jgi:putative ABC transport system substrate-binding protein
MTALIGRREFITLLGGAAAWPVLARAQQGSGMRRIGFLSGGLTPGDPDTQAQITAFQQGLEGLGWSIGRNVRIDYRWGLGDAGNIRKYAEELGGNSTMSSMLQATRTVPIVFVNVADPVGSGFVDSLARPGGNATGFVQFEYNLSGKWPELLKEIAPGVTRAAVLRDPALVSFLSRNA